jgi:hypothetical protein
MTAGSIDSASLFSFGNRRTIEASLQFTKRGDEKPYIYVGEPPEGVPSARCEYENHHVIIDDARPFADQLSLDVEGSTLVRSPSRVADFFDETEVMSRARPEAAELVKAITGAWRVEVFDHTVRRRSNDADYAPGVPRQPASWVHVDQTVASGRKRIREIMGDEAEALLQGRVAIINVWRPIGYPARDWPLVLGDARSIPMADLIAIDRIFPDRRGETYGLAYNPRHRWLYVPDVQPDEATLIKCWDSQENVARFTPHSAFQDPTTPADTPPRQSIEIRTMAFFDQ